MSHYIEANANLIKEQIEQVLPVIEQELDVIAEQDRIENERRNEKREEAKKKWNQFEKQCIDRIKNEVSTYTVTKWQWRRPFIKKYKVTDPAIEERFTYDDLKALAKRKFEHEWRRQRRIRDFERDTFGYGLGLGHGLHLESSLIQARNDLLRLLDTTRKVCNDPEQQTLWIDADEYHKLIGKRLNEQEKNENVDNQTTN